MKNNKGITLIALVITIIVLLILAGVSIAMLTGNNGILTQANNAKSDTAKAEAVERINLVLNAAYAEAMATPSVKPTVSKMQTYDTGLTAENGYSFDDTTDTSKITVKYNKNGITTSGSILVESPYTIDAAK